MEGFIVLILVFVVYTWAVFAANQSISRRPAPCPPHKWTRGADDKLKCASCGRLPGVDYAE